jgi:hypothetical protein
MKPSLVEFTQPELIIWAGIDDMFVEPMLAYSFIGDNGYQNGDSSPEKYLFVADAETGDILYFENLIISVDVNGNVQGKATQGVGADICGDELAEIFKYARVNIGTEIAYTDENGNFTISNSGSSPVTVESRLWGEWFRVFNQAGADTVLSKVVTPPGPANFMHNNPNNDEYKRAEVNGYYYANIVRDFTIKYNPDYPGLDENAFPVNVNLNDNCNAYYDYSSINFFTSGGGCPNTAFSTIIHHEYGHHLVAMAGSGQGEYGEGMSDVMGVLITDDPGLAYGFFSDCDEPLRNASNDIDYPCSGGIHYCGQVLSGCVWETRNELVITNPDNYTDIISNLAINAMLLHTGSTIDPSITIDYLVLDDDNGNITDGTPHYCEIAAGFGAHNMDAPPAAPRIPDAPDGPDDGIWNIEYMFNATTIDCEGDQIYYMFDWDDGEYSGWIGPYNSGDTGSASHIWIKGGIFEVRAKAKDEYGRECGWSEPAFLSIVENVKPTKVVIEGPTWGFGGEEYEFTFVSTDPEGEDISYRILWDDGNDTGYLGPYSSGEQITLSHKWKLKGEYWIKAWAKDTWGGKSNQASHKINILTSSAHSYQRNPLFIQIIERIPLLQKLIQNLGL